MSRLPPALAGQQFPTATSPSGAVTTTSRGRVQKNIETLGLDHLIAIGGDDIAQLRGRARRDSNT